MGFSASPVVCFLSSGLLLPIGTSLRRACLHVYVSVCLILLDPKTLTMKLNRLNLCCIATGNKLFTELSLFSR